MILYRYEKTCTEETLTDSKGKSNVRIYCREIYVTRETKCRYYFFDRGRERFTLKDLGKRYAYPNKKDALRAYIYRCRRSISLSNFHVQFSKLGLEAALAKMDRMEAAAGCK